MRELYSFYFDAFWIAVKSILEHKLRAFLTLIGIIIGVAAVVVVGASITGLKTYVIDKVGKVLGANHFMVTRIAFMGKMDEDMFEKMNRRNKDIIWAEYEYVKANCKTCLEVGAEMISNADLSQNGVEMPSTQIQGVTANFDVMEDKTLSEGRFMSPTEVDHSSEVCVIGADVAEKFFPVGSSVGVEEKRGSFMGNSMDRHLYMPLTLYAQMFSRTGGLQLHGKSANQETFQAAIDETRLLLRNKRQLIGSEEDTFGLVNTEQFTSQMDQFTGAIAAVVVPITMIILIVGGIVVMNIMLVSVTERTFEVGLRKALGATKKQILLQFLIESALLCVVGGIIGLALATGVAQLIAVLAGMTMTITFGYVILSVAVSSIIGVVAGLYPAWKAAGLDPIVALAQN